MAYIKLERLPMAAATLIVVLVVTACAIRLRDDESQAPSTASARQTSDPLAAKLAECRSVSSEQKEALSGCRKAWTEQRRQFLGQVSSTLPGRGNPREGSSLFVAPKDESRLPSDDPAVERSGKE